MKPLKILRRVVMGNDEDTVTLQECETWKGTRVTLVDHNGRRFETVSPMWCELNWYRALPIIKDIQF